MCVCLFFVWVCPCSGTCKVFSNKLRNNSEYFEEEKKKVKKEMTGCGVGKDSTEGRFWKENMDLGVSKSNRAVLTL